MTVNFRVTTVGFEWWSLTEVDIGIENIKENWSMLFAIDSVPLKESFTSYQLLKASLIKLISLIKESFPSKCFLLVGENHLSDKLCDLNRIGFTSFPIACPMIYAKPLNDILQ